MSVQRIPASGPPEPGRKLRFKARVKVGRVQVAARTFDTLAAAKRWEADQRAQLAGGFDPRRGKLTVGEFANTYLEHRATRVQPGTLGADRNMVAHLPMWLSKLEFTAVTARHIEKFQNDLLTAGTTRATVSRYRQALSPMFKRAIDEGRIAKNPVAGAATLGRSAPNLDAINPFPTRQEFLAEVDRIAGRNWVVAEVYLLLGFLGLRWSEMRALTVADVRWTSDPAYLLVTKAQPEGEALKTTKSERDRQVPVDPLLLPILRRFATGKKSTDLLVTMPSGAQLHRQPFLLAAGLSTYTREAVVTYQVDTAGRTILHEKGRHKGTPKVASRWYKRTLVPGARRIHDLRHTAAILWLRAGVPLHAVKSYLGHSSLKTTERYLTHVGSSADRAVLSLLPPTWD